MKKYIAAAIVLALIASCAPQKTCPTYLKNTKKIESAVKA